MFCGPAGNRMYASARSPVLSWRAISRSDRSLICSPLEPISPRFWVVSNTPGGDVYPRSDSFSVDTIEAITSPSGLPSEPASPAIGFSDRRTQLVPTKWRRARANRATTSGSPRSGATTVRRMC